MEYVSSAIIIIMMMALVAMLFYVLSNAHKTTLHYLFTAIILELLMWETSVLIGGIFQDDPGIFVPIDNFAYLGAAFLPATVLLLGLAYQRNFNGFKAAHLILLMPSVFIAAMIFTNDYHHLFYQSYEPGTGYAFGPIFYFYAIYSYGCMVIGMVLLCYSAVKASGLFSTQALIFFTGSIIPMIANVGYTLSLPGFNVYTTPIALSMTILLFTFAIFRLGLFRIVPVATRVVMNRMSDCFVVVDDKLGLLDCNLAFSEHFLQSASSTKTSGLSSALSSRPGLTDEQVDHMCAEARRALAETTILTEDLAIAEDETTYYNVEYSPIVERNQPAAVIILFRNVTQHVNDLRALKENQDILLERERLASLGQMIGGIAHNLKSPIFAISGGLDQIKCLTEEYRDAIGDADITDDDHREIADDMEKWLAKMRIQLSYMSDIISTVKGQAAQLSEEKNEPFTVGEVLKRSNILMQHAFVESNCTPRSDIRIDPATAIYGDINSFVQVLNNVVENAIQSYEGNGGSVRVTVEQMEGHVLFSVADDGACIDPETQTLLFKQMTTTKGKNGTGLGLYMSYSTIKGMFRGNMWFRSEPGEETVFYIQLPLSPRQG